MPRRTGFVAAGASTLRGRYGSRQHKAVVDSGWTVPVLSTNYCFSGGEMAPHESRVLMMVGAEEAPEMKLDNSPKYHSAAECCKGWEGRER